MRMVQHLWRAFVLVSSLALVAGCGDSDNGTGGGGSGGSGGTGGVGGTGGDGGSGGVGGTGGTVVEGEPPRIEDPSGITIIAPDEARRGPVLLRFELGEVGAGDEAIRLERQVEANWEEATAVVTRDDDRVLIAWDSFADFDGDGDVSLRLVVDETTTEPFVVPMLNDPDTARIIAVSHGSILENNAAVQKGKEISVFSWSAAESGEPRRLEVGVGPGRMSAAPHGRTIAVLNMTESTVSLVATPLDAAVEGAEELHRLALPHGSLQDLSWSHDGRYLYVLGTGGDGKPSTLWRYEPTEGLTSVSDPLALATFPGNGMRFAVVPGSARLLVAVYDFDASQPFLALLEEDGSEVTRRNIALNLRGLNDFAISPAGDYVIGTTKVFGDETHIFRLDGDAIEDVEMRTDVRAPSGIYFHPSSTVGSATAIVTNFSTNRATALVLSGSDVTVMEPVAGLPLGAYVDGIQRGENVGTAFIPTVNRGSNVSTVQLDLAGEVVVGEEVASFGDGAEALPDGIAVQR